MATTLTSGSVTCQCGPWNTKETHWINSVPARRKGDPGQGVVEVNRRQQEPTKVRASMLVQGSTLPIPPSYQCWRFSNGVHSPRSSKPLVLEVLVQGSTLPVPPSYESWTSSEPRHHYMGVNYLFIHHCWLLELPVPCPSLDIWLVRFLFQSSKHMVGFQGN